MRGDSRPQSDTDVHKWFRLIQSTPLYVEIDQSNASLKMRQSAAMERLCEAW